MVVLFMATTHAPLGTCLALLILPLLTSVVPLPMDPALGVVLTILVGMIGGLLPDMDRSSAVAANAGRSIGSILQRGGAVSGHNMVGGLIGIIFELINIPIHLGASYIEHKLGHRGPIHSFTMALLIAGLFTLITTIFIGLGLPVFLAVGLVYLLITPLVAGLVLVWFYSPILIFLAILIGSGGVAGLVFNLWPFMRGIEQAVIVLIARAVPWMGVYWLLVAGYVSHLWGDGCTKSAVGYLWWPLAYTVSKGQQRGVLAVMVGWRVVPKLLRVKASGWVGTVVGVLAILGAALLSAFNLMLRVKG